jgi:DNA-binding MarR family transcriptional regulator
VEDGALPFDPIAEAARNWDARAWPEVDAMAAVTSITRAHRIALSRIDAALSPLGLNFARFEALALLVVSRTGALPLGKMGQRLQVHAASVTNTIDRLERAGLVRRVPHPTDGRTTLAQITPQGREIAERATEALGRIRFGAVGLSDAAARRVTDELTAMRRAAGDFLDGPGQATP